MKIRLLSENNESVFHRLLKSSIAVFSLGGPLDGFVEEAPYTFSNERMNEFFVGGLQCGMNSGRLDCQVRQLSARLELIY